MHKSNEAVGCEGWKRGLANARARYEELLEQLNGAMRNQEDMEMEIFKGESNGFDGTQAELKRWQRLLDAVSLPNRAKALKDLSIALGNIIQLERQAHNIDGDGKRPAASKQSRSLLRIRPVEGGKPVLGAGSAAWGAPEAQGRVPMKVSLFRP